MKTFSEWLLEDIINNADKGNWTALHYAVSKNNLDMVKALVKNGADVNAITYSGHTPLSLAYEGLKFANYNKLHPSSYLSEKAKKELPIFTEIVHILNKAGAK